MDARFRGHDNKWFCLMNSDLEAADRFEHHDNGGHHGQQRAHDRTLAGVENPLLGMARFA